MPRGGNAGGGGQPGWVLKCKGWETDPNAYIYFTIQEQNWERTCQAIGRPEWIDDPAYSTAKAREPHIFEIFDEIEKWLADKTKYEAVDILRKFEVPCAPVLSMKEIAHDPALRASGTIVEVAHKERGTYLTVGSPIKFSDFTPEITGSPLLGEHTDDVLTNWATTPTRSPTCTATASCEKGARQRAGRQDPCSPARSRSGLSVGAAVVKQQAAKVGILRRVLHGRGVVNLNVAG